MARWLAGCPQGGRPSTSPRVPLRPTGAAILQVHYDAGLGLPEL